MSRTAAHRRPKTPGHNRYALNVGLVQLLNWGVLHYSFGVLLPEMHRDTGLSLTFLSGIPALAALTGAGSALLLGRYWRTGDARRSLVTGLALAAVALGAWSAAETAAQFLAVAMLLGVCQAMTLYDAAFMLVRQQVAQAALRPRIFLLLTLVGGLASTVLVPLTGGLVAVLSWRPALIVLAAMLLLMSLPLILMLQPPATGECENTREPVSVTPIDHAPEPGVTPAILRLWTFTLSLVGSALAALLPICLLDRGFTQPVMLTLVALLGAMQLVGRILLPWLISRFNLFWLIQATPLILGVSIATLAILPPALAWLAILPLGTAAGLGSLLRPLALERSSDTAQYARLNGQLASLGLLARALGPIAAGAGFQVLQSGSGVLTGIAVVAITGACAIRTLRQDHGAP